MTTPIQQAGFDLLDQEGLLHLKKVVVPRPTYYLEGVQCTTAPIGLIDMIQNRRIVVVLRIVRENLSSTDRQPKVLTRSDEKMPFGFPDVDGIASIAL